MGLLKSVPGLQGEEERGKGTGTGVDNVNKNLNTCDRYIGVPGKWEKSFVKIESMKLITSDQYALAEEIFSTIL